MKPRADGLYARLFEADPTGQLREQVFMEMLGGRNLEDIAADLRDGGAGGSVSDLATLMERLGKGGLEASVSSLSKMLGRYGVQFKVEEAYKAAAKLDNFDAGQAAVARRKGLAAQLASAAYQRLSVKELVALKSLDLEEQDAAARLMAAEAALLSAQEQAATWIVETLREVDKRSALSEIACGDGELSTRIARVREIVFGKELATKGGAA